MNKDIQDTQNLNNDYYANTDENFKNALEFFQADYTHSQIIELLKNGNIPQKQIAALKLETLESDEDAMVLLSNLTGQDGKIREVVSLRISEFMSKPENIKYFNAENNCGVFLDAIIDINPNICRNIISGLENLKNNDSFCNVFCKKLAGLTLSLLDIVEKFDFQDGKYKVNKEAFKLYWCLETIDVFWDKLDFTDLKTIILRSKSIGEYTIREKAAKILTHDFKDNELCKARQELKNDRNYYVRRF